MGDEQTGGDWAERVAGWRYPQPEVGRFGDNFLRPAADQCLADIAASDPAESVYLLNFQDADGTHFAPQGRYELHFRTDELPPVAAFWQLAAYTAADVNLIANPADRYSIGDHAATLTTARWSWRCRRPCVSRTSPSRLSRSFPKGEAAAIAEP